MKKLCVLLLLAVAGCRTAVNDRRLDAQHSITVSADRSAAPLPPLPPGTNNAIRTPLLPQRASPALAAIAAPPALESFYPPRPHVTRNLILLDTTANTEELIYPAQALIWSIEGGRRWRDLTFHGLTNSARVVLERSDDGELWEQLGHWQEVQNADLFPNLTVQAPADESQWRLHILRP